MMEGINEIFIKSSPPSTNTQPWGENFRKTWGEEQENMVSKKEFKTPKILKYQWHKSGDLLLNVLLEQWLYHSNKFSCTLHTTSKRQTQMFPLKNVKKFFI